MYDLMCVGTLSIDLYFHGDTLTMSGDRFTLACGGKYFVDHFYESLGGGATNVAIGVHHHGLRAGLRAIIGNNDFKSMVFERLNKESISHMYCPVVENHLNISTILLSPTGEKVVINYQPQQQHMFETEAEFSILKKARALYMGNLPDISFRQKCALLAHAKRNNIFTIANFGVMDCRRPLSEVFRLLRDVDVIIVNGYEFADMVKKKYAQLAFKAGLIEKYFSEYAHKLFVITDGKKGSYAFLKGEFHKQKAIEPKKIIDATGAGDGFSAGFVSGLLKNKSVKESMEMGAAYAAVILAKIGAN